MEAAAASAVPVAQQGCAERELTLCSGRSFVIALLWDRSRSLPICSLPSPRSQDVCECVRARAWAQSTAQQSHGCRVVAAGSSES